MSIQHIKVSSVSDSTIRRAIRKGDLPPLPESPREGKYVFDLDQVEAWAPGSTASAPTLFFATPKAPSEFAALPRADQPARPRLFTSSTTRSIAAFAARSVSAVLPGCWSSAVANSVAQTTPRSWTMPMGSVLAVRAQVMFSFLAKVATAHAE